MKPFPEQSPHWTPVLNLVGDARHDPELLYKLREGAPEELDQIYKTYGITIDDLELCRADLRLFERPNAYGKWFFLTDPTTPFE